MESFDDDGDGDEDFVSYRPNDGAFIVTATAPGLTVYDVFWHSSAADGLPGVFPMRLSTLDRLIAYDPDGGADGLIMYRPGTYAVHASPVLPI